MLMFKLVYERNLLKVIQKQLNIIVKSLKVIKILNNYVIKISRVLHFYWIERLNNWYSQKVCCICCILKNSMQVECLKSYHYTLVGMSENWVILEEVNIFWNSFCSVA